MKTDSFLFAMLTCLSFGCTGKQAEVKMPVPKKSFGYFEISYHGGWQGGFSFTADSNKNFTSPGLFVPIGLDTIKYGILPDSIFYSLNKFAQFIQKDTAIRSTYNYCDDCSSVAIKTIVEKDTFRIFQVDEISKPVWQLIEKLDAFINHTKHTYKLAALHLETAKQVASPPPPPKLRRNTN
jgi:hypothetical protein